VESDEIKLQISSCSFGDYCESKGEVKLAEKEDNFGSWISDMFITGASYTAKAIRDELREF